MKNARITLILAFLILSLVGGGIAMPVDGVDYVETDVSSIGPGDLQQHDFLNLATCPGFEDFDSVNPQWILPTGWTVQSTNARTGLKSAKATSAASGASATSTNLFEVTPGEKIYFEAWIKASSSAATLGYLNFGVEFLDVDKAHISYWTETFITTRPTTYTKIFRLPNELAVAPANSVWCRAVFFTSSQTAGNWYIDDVFVGRMIRPQTIDSIGELIVEDLVIENGFIFNGGGGAGFLYADDPGMTGQFTVQQIAQDGADGDLLIGRAGASPIAGQLVGENGIVITPGIGEIEISLLDAEVRHIIGTGANPGIAAGTGAGTGPTISVSATSNDLSGVIILTTGTSPVAPGTVCTITFVVAFATNARITLTPGNGNAAALAGASRVYVDHAIGTTATFLVKVGSGGLAASTDYRWVYSVQS